MFGKKRGVHKGLCEAGSWRPSTVQLTKPMRVLRLSFLAPDLIDAILAWHQPPTFTLEPFRRPIPLEWAAQRKLFGFPPL